MRQIGALSARVWWRVIEAVNNLTAKHAAGPVFGGVARVGRRRLAQSALRLRAIE